ncbi:zinc finger and SCAN domain-containing protein 12-like [Pararge aegeria]|nr:zinc finger and SCAN domain-containing protein 12-like [Pararge aegeria]
MPGNRKICRACLVAIDTFKYYLFDNVSPDVYWFCTNIEVLKDENLPKSICNTCFDLITKFSEFKKTCLQSQNHLLNYYSVIPENKKLDWLNNEPSAINTQKDVLIKFEEEYKNVTVKDEVEYNDDFTTVEIPIELDDKIKKKKTHKSVQVKGAKGKRKLKSERFEARKLARNTKIVSLKCAPCNKTFATWSGLKRHHANCHVRISLASVKCRTCGKIAKTRESLRVHEKSHGERNMYICNVCGKACTTSGGLQAHLETHKENRERHYACEHCEKKFYTKRILLSHVHRCHTGKQYICQICSYPFTDKYNLAQHLLNHDGKGRAYKCDVCNKSYTSKSALMEHQRSHSGERPFVCKYCSKSFISKKRLTEHHRTHTGEKPHKCPVCQHGFAQRGTMNRHMKVHDRTVPIINSSMP